MIRKLEQPIPQELQALLVPEEATKIVLGKSLYEMAPMGLEDFEDVKFLWGQVLEIVSVQESITTEALISAITRSGIFQKLLGKIYGFTESEMNNITLAQLLYAAEVFIRINFFCLPASSLQGIARIIAYFINILSTSGNASLSEPSEQNEEPATTNPKE